MAGDDLLIRVDAQVTEFEAAFGKATSSTLRFEAALKTASAQQALLEKQIRTYGANSAQATTAMTRAAAANARLVEQQQKRIAEQYAAMQTAGRGLIVTGAAITLALGVSAKAAIDWEQGFQQVAKAIQGTPEQIQAVADGLLDLSKTIPVTSDELLNIASEAAQLGVATPNIVEFTRVIAELSRTAPDLTDGAASLAKFLNVTRTSTDQVSNLASSLTALGQQGASTVDTIVELGLRLASAGHQAGLSDGDILGLGSTMASLGIQAEAGGTAISRTFQQISLAVADGGQKLDAFATTAGVSSAQFAKQWGTDAAGAFRTFLGGLDKIQKSGGDVYGTLANLGIVAQRQIPVLLNLATSGDKLAASQKLANDEFEKNAALQETFAKVQATTASQIQLATNNIHALAIQIGTGLLPVIGDLADKTGDVAKAFASLPGPVREGVAVLAVMAATIGLVGGAALLASVKVAKLRTTLASLNASGSSFATRMGAARVGAIGLATGLEVLNSNIDDSHGTLKDLVSITADAALGFSVGGPLGAAVGGAIGLFVALSGSTEAAAVSFDTLAKNATSATQVLTDANRAAVAAQISGDQSIIDAAASLGIGLSTVTDAALGQAKALDELASAKTRLGATGTVTPEQLTAIQILTGFVDKQNGEVSKAKAYLDAYGSASAGAADDTDHLSAAEQNAAAQTEALNQAFTRLTATLSDRSSLRDYEAAIDDATAALKKNGKTLSNNTEAGRENAAALDNIAKTAIAHAQAMDKDGKSIAAQRAYIQGARQDLIAQAEAFGMSETKAKNYADAVLKIPSKAKTQIESNAAEAKRAIDAVLTSLRAIDIFNATPTITTTHLNLSTHERLHEAAGGYVTGPGTSTSDSIPARLSNGEFVMRASAVRQYGLDTMRAMNSQRLADGGPVGWALPRGSSTKIGIQRQANVNLNGPIYTYDPQQLARRIGREQQRAVEMAAS